VTKFNQFCNTNLLQSQPHLFSQHSVWTTSLVSYLSKQDILKCNQPHTGVSQQISVRTLLNL